MSAFPHQVDVYQRDDTATGRRAGVKPTATKVASAVRCGVHELSAMRRAAFDREQMTVSHTVQFRTALATDGGEPLALDNSHYLAYTDPDTEAVRTLNVKGYKRPSHRGLPYVASCEEVAT
ncbi:MAG: hypothetical protein P4L84_35035 [Isosphaeraceae bacterium]|nr:hypothetical protein [Isosphaeraceae bacterium]